MATRLDANISVLDIADATEPFVVDIKKGNGGVLQLSGVVH